MNRRPSEIRAVRLWKVKDQVDLDQSLNKVQRASKNYVQEKLPTVLHGMKASPVLVESSKENTKVCAPTHTNVSNAQVTTGTVTKRTTAAGSVRSTTNSYYTYVEPRGLVHLTKDPKARPSYDYYSTYNVRHSVRKFCMDTRSTIRSYRTYYHRQSHGATSLLLMQIMFYVVSRRALT